MHASKLRAEVSYNGRNLSLRVVLWLLLLTLPYNTNIIHLNSGSKRIIAAGAKRNAFFTRCSDALVLETDSSPSQAAFFSL